MSVEVQAVQPVITMEKPELLDGKNIIYWSSSLKQIEGVKECSAIRTKALKFLRDEKIKYDPELKAFIVLHIEGYNKTDYTVKGEEGHLACNCQFYNKANKFWEHPRCSHTLAVHLWLEIHRWNKKGVQHDILPYPKGFGYP